MPHYCIVPLCKNHSGTKEISFHRLPLNNKQLLKRWICKIKRENIPLNKYSRVCSVHFEGGKKKGPNDVPTIFAWTPSTRAPPKPRECTNQLEDACMESEQGDLVADNGDTVHTCDVETTTDPLYTDTVLTNTDLLGEDVGTQTPRSVFDDAQIQTISHVCHVAVQLPLQSDHNETQTVCYTQHSGTITDNSETDASPFLLEQIQDDNQAIKILHRVSTFSHLIACFNFLGPAVFNLCYATPKNDTKCGWTSSLFIAIK